MDLIDEDRSHEPTVKEEEREREVQGMGAKGVPEEWQGHELDAR